MDSASQPTNTADHDLLIRIDTKLDSYIASSNTTLQDHEQRIRSVERTNQRLKGAQWILGGLVTLIGVGLSVLQFVVG